jgi:antirestriction protein
MQTLPAHGIYVACLASYNNGVLFGEWIDLDGKDKEDILWEIKDMLSRSPTPGAEEYAVHDYSGVPSRFGEWPEWQKLVDYVEACNQCSGPTEEEAWDFYCQNMDNADFDQFRDDYQGVYESRQDYAMSHFEEDEGLAKLNPILSSCINWEAVFEDLRCEGGIWSQFGEYGLHVFWNR